MIPSRQRGRCDRDSGRLQGSAPPQAGIKPRDSAPAESRLASKVVLDWDGTVTEVEEIAPITIAATMPAARPPVPITSAASATATTRLTQKPGSESSLVTNSNAALSAFHAAFAALLILPQRPPSSFGGSLRRLRVDLGLALGDLALVLARDLARAALDLGRGRVELALGPAQARRELRLDLAAGLLDLVAELRDGLVAASAWPTSRCS